MNFFKLAITAIAFTVASAGITAYFGGQRQEDFDKQADDVNILQKQLAAARNEETARLTKSKYRAVRAMAVSNIVSRGGDPEGGRQKISSQALGTAEASTLAYQGRTANLSDLIGDAKTELAKLQAAGPGFGESVTTAGLGLASSLTGRAAGAQYKTDKSFLENLDWNVE